MVESEAAEFQVEAEDDRLAKARGKAREEFTRIQGSTNFRDNMGNPETGTVKIERKHLDGFFLDGLETLARSTHKHYTESLEMFWKHCRNRLDDGYTRKLVKGFCDKLKINGVSETMVCNHMVAVQSFFSWLVNEEIIEVNPLYGAKKQARWIPKREKTTFTPDEYARMKEVAKAYDATKPAGESYWFGGLVIGWNTGLRLSDVAQLEWSEVNLVSDSIKLIPQKQARRGTKIEFPMTPELAAWIKEHRRNQVNPKRFVQSFMAGNYMLDSSFLSCEFRTKIMVPAGVPKGKSFHSLRRSFVTRAIEADISPAMVSQITGQGIETVMSYCRAGLEVKRSEMDKMNRL